MYIHPMYHWPPKSEWTDPSPEFNDWGHYSAYVHFPYCRHICEFCGYEKRLIEKSGANAFADNAIRQIDATIEISDFSSSTKRALFFGGGTASLMPTSGLVKILEHFSTLPGNWDEVTLECEPGTISRDQLAAAKEAGVNRIGVCAQSFDDDQLKRIGRKHKSGDAYKLIDDCVALGFKNIHVDLMYALPGMDLELWQSTLETVAALPIHHISAYKLYIFKHSLYQRSGLVPRMEMQTDDETRLGAEMCKLIPEVMGTVGIEQYSLTEYAKPGFECQYVTSCFDGSDVMPIGPSAFGRCGNNVWDNSPYAKLYGSEDFGADLNRTARLSPAEALKRDVLLGFWLLGCDLRALAHKQQVEVSDDLNGLLHKLSENDWVEFDGNSISLSSEQGYWCGWAMEELGQLPSNQWILGSDTDKHSSASNTVSRTEVDTDAILRMARRDPKFFNELKEAPEETMKRIGYDLSVRGPATVTAIIKGGHTKVSGLDVAEQAFLKEWALVKDEYNRSLKV